MAPFAYGLREHVIFEQPHPIDVTATVTKQTPSPWKPYLDAGRVEILPLIDTVKGPIGWCTAGATLDAPDVEVMCGGINTKQPTHAAVWRQGNLLHFGFEPSPSQFNDDGRALLLNSISYIARFTEDRPIAVTPSPLSGRPFVMSKRFIERTLGDAKATAKDVANYFGAPWNEKLAAMPAAEAKAFVREHDSYIRHDGEKLIFDEDAIALGAPLDRREFLNRMRGTLAADDPRAVKLLSRMVVDGPEKAADWERWLGRNADYLFFSEGAGYVWLVDPLAKQRGVPTAELRGPRRADDGS